MWKKKYAHHKREMRYKKQENNLYTIYFNEDKFENVILLAKFGSRLYGTNSELSDYDYKAIYIESLRDIILNKDKETQNISSGTNDSHNSNKDIDIEFIELRKFIKDASKGQTYAMEILNINKKIITTPIFNDLQKRKSSFLSKNLKPFLGYCKAQASKYGLKGERYKATEEAYNFLINCNKKKVIDIVKDIPKNEYVFMKTFVLDEQNKEIELLQINEKQFVMSINIDDAAKIVKKQLDKFGQRSKSASEGVDWKAVSHAFRVLYEYEEIQSTGNIVFPLQYADFLKNIKYGKIEYAEVQQKISDEYDRISSIESTFPDEPTTQWVDDWVVNLYTSM